jgi:hypothetical protein
MSAPSWLPLLDKDIRKLPALRKRQRRTATDQSESASNASPPQTSTSTSSPYTSRNGETSATSATELIDPPPLRAFRKKPKKSHVGHFLQTQVKEQPQRYWNEYDDPESGDEEYYIYVDPNAEVKFPGQEFWEACVRMTKNLFGIGKADGEESPLLSAADYGSSDEESADEAPNVGIKSYGTIPSDRITFPYEGYFSNLFRSFRKQYRDTEDPNFARRQSEYERQTLLTTIQVQYREREMAKFQLYSSCLAAGIVLDLVLCMLFNTSRRKLRGEVDSAIILGVICNMILLLVAVTSMLTRHDRLGWFHQGIVVMTVVSMVVVDALLFRWALNL